MVQVLLGETSAPLLLISRQHVVENRIDGDGPGFAPLAAYLQVPSPRLATHGPEIESDRLGLTDAGDAEGGH